MKHFLFLIIVALFLSSVNDAKAQTCVASNTPVNFGTINTVTGAAFDSTATMQITCIGTAGQTVRVCTSFGSGSGGSTNGNPRTMVSGVNALNYSLYTNGALNNIWGSFVWPFVGSYPGMKTVISIPPAGSAIANLTVYARVLAGQQATAQGNYSSSFAGHTLITYDYNYLSPCSSPPLLTTFTSFVVSAFIGTNCQISATDIDFGTVGITSANVDTTSTISAVCTPNTPYSLSLSNGITGLSPSARKMMQGVNAVTYGLYRDAARTQIWGDTLGVNTLAGSGTGSTQNITVYGRMPPQSSPPPGTYTDTINVTITY